MSIDHLFRIALDFIASQGLDGCNLEELWNHVIQQQQSKQQQLNSFIFEGPLDKSTIQNVVLDDDMK